MRGKQVIRAAIVCGAAGIVCVLWSAVDDTAAHSAGRSSDLLPSVAVELPHRLVEDLGHAAEQIPQRATNLTKAATTPEPVTNALDPVEQIRATVVDAVKPLAGNTPRPSAPLKVPVAPATPPPADKPAPDAPEPTSAVVLLAGAAPSTVTLDPTQADSIGPAAASALLCGDDTDELELPRPSHAAAPSAAPCIPQDRDTTGLATLKPPTQTGADQLAAITPSGPATPALRLLGELLPRSDLPTGRTTHPEPGPA